MERLSQLVIFSLDERKFALNLSAVQRVIQVAEVTALPAAPEIVVGIINMQGQVTIAYQMALGGATHTGLRKWLAPLRLPYTRTAPERSQSPSITLLKASLPTKSPMPSSAPILQRHRPPGCRKSSPSTWTNILVKSK
jgi:hypothetical protein